MPLTFGCNLVLSSVALELEFDRLVAVAGVVPVLDGAEWGDKLLTKLSSRDGTIDGSSGIHGQVRETRSRVDRRSETGLVRAKDGSPDRNATDLNCLQSDVPVGAGHDGEGHE